MYMRLTPLALLAAENPQDPHHFDIAQNSESRKGLPGAHRACEEQGSPREGPSPSPNQEPENHYEEDTMW